MNKLLVRMRGYDRYALNYFRKREVDVLNISYETDGCVYTIWEDDLEKLDNGLIEVVSYRGIKFLWQKIKRNRHFLIAVILSMAIMCQTSRIVVDVEVIHSNKDIRVLIEDELYERGVKPLTLKKSFEELQEIKEEIKKEYPENIEWLEIVDDGMKYTVRVEERIITRPKEQHEYCNIISTKDAIILSVVPKMGQSIVLPNDFVKKDDILISGGITLNDEIKSHVCADGVVYGNTWYRVAITVPLEHTTKNYTKKKKFNLGVEFGSTYNRIFKVHMDEYDVEKKKILGIGKFALYKEKILEYEGVKEKYSEEEAIETAIEEGKEKLLVKLGSQSEILNEKVLQSSSYDSIMNVEIFYSVKEVISTQVEAKIEEQKKEENSE